MGDTQPTVPLPEPAVDAPEARRRRVWPWIAAAVALVALLVGAWFLAERIAHDLVVSTVRVQLIDQLDLPADQRIDVRIDGDVLPQLIAGRLEGLTVASDDVVLGPLAGDVTVRAQGITIRGDAAAESASARVVLDAEQLRGLLSTLDGIPVDTIDLAAPDVTMSIELPLLGAIGVALTPEAVDGDIVLSPAGLRLGGLAVSADDLRDRFGPIVDAVVRDWTICIAEHLPAGVALRSVEVEGEAVVAELDVDGRIVSAGALQAKGTCD